jgi:hypothetical protein
MFEFEISSADFLFSKNDEPLLVTASSAPAAVGTGEKLSEKSGSFVGKEQFCGGCFKEPEGSTVDGGESLEVEEVEHISMKAENVKLRNQVKLQVTKDDIRTKSGEQPKHPDSLTRSTFADEGKVHLQIIDLRLSA